jgi:hypothetical protein
MNRFGAMSRIFAVSVIEIVPCATVSRCQAAALASRARASATRSGSAPSASSRSEKLAAIRVLRALRPSGAIVDVAAAVMPAC